MQAVQQRQSGQLPGPDVAHIRHKSHSGHRSNIVTELPQSLDCRVWSRWAGSHLCAAKSLYIGSRRLELRP